MYISKAASITALLENAGGSLPCLASELNHTSLEILAFLMKTIFKKKKKKTVCLTRWNAWTIFNASFRRHVSYESLGPLLVWQRELCPTSLWERGTKLLFWAFYIGVCFKQGGKKKKSSNVESRQKRWGWNLEAIHPARAAAALWRWGSPYTA